MDGVATMAIAVRQYIDNKRATRYLIGAASSRGWDESMDPLECSIEGRSAAAMSVVNNCGWLGWPKVNLVPVSGMGQATQFWFD